MSRKRNRRAKKRIPVLIVLILIAVFAVAAVLSERFLPSRDKADLNKLYGSEEGYASILANHQWSESKALNTLGHAYLSYETIHNELNSRFYYDPVKELLLYTLPDETIQADTETAYDDAPVFLLQDDTVWISLSYVEQYSNIKVDFFKDPDRVVIQTEWGSEKKATILKQTDLRLKGGIHSPILTELNEGDSVVVLDQMDNWSKIQSPDGFVGYVKNKTLSQVEEVVEKGPYQEPEYTGHPVDHEVRMIWQQTFKNSGLEGLKAFVKKGTPINTVSPSWFSLMDNQGSISTLADKEYVETAHKAGMDVWPMLENVNQTGLDMKLVLQSTDNRTKIVDAVMVELEECGADGLNVDLESISKEASDGYIQLIRELSVACRARGLVLSIDDPVPSSWTSYYNRREQGIVADYVINMGYDEHYSGSDPGSTASLPFVQSAIESTLNEVPAEKVINGLPFYTRLWIDSEDGLTSQALGMEKAAQWVKDNGLTTSWQDDAGQNYASAKIEGSYYQIWLEDEESMKGRFQQMQAYGLAGYSFWKMGMQDDAIWPVIAAFSGLEVNPVVEETEAETTTAAETQASAAAGAETETAETKAPAESKSAESKSAETKSAESKSAESKPAESKSAETKSAESKSAETKASGTKSQETKPAETKAPAEETTKAPLTAGLTMT